MSMLSGELKGCFEGLPADIIPIAVDGFTINKSKMGMVGRNSHMLTRPSFSSTSRVFVVL